MNRFAPVRYALLFVALALAWASPALAHEGHEHKIMGTVSMLHENHLEIRDKDGKTHVIALNAATRITKAKTAIKASEIKTGDRIVATVVTEKGAMIAKEIQVGTSAKSKASETPR